MDLKMLAVLMLDQSWRRKEREEETQFQSYNDAGFDVEEAAWIWHCRIASCFEGLGYTARI